MPLPLGHAVVGFSVTAASGVPFRRQTLTAILFSIVVANLPDLDFLPGALANTPVLYHRTVAHTLPAALLCGLIVGAVLTRFRARFWEISLLAAAVYASHLFADMVDLGGDNIGVQLLWPFTENWYSIQTPFSGTDGGWLTFNRGDDSAGFFASLLSLDFLRVQLLQGLAFAPTLLIPWLAHRRRVRSLAKDRLDPGSLPAKLGTTDGVDVGA
jgi:membrane-bound metal-dependent hydrolase YbcI (DUF457 family)